MIFTYEGMAGLMIRTFMGLGSELPLYYSKFTMSGEDKFCIKGESIAKILSIIVDWSI